MSSTFLLLVITVIAGFSAIRWASRMAPLTSELPAKTLIATLFAGLAAAAEYGMIGAPTWLITAALIVGPLFVFGPLALVYAVRAGAWRPALLVVRLLYWTPEGRNAIGRLLAQAALQEGNPEAALALAPARDALLLTQAHLLEGDWQAVLGVAPPAATGPSADNAHLVAAARIEALLELGRSDEAKAELSALKTRFGAGPQGPLGHRAVVLSEARVNAYDGNLPGTRAQLEQPLAGVRPATVYHIMATAAERSGNRDFAQRAYAAAYQHAGGLERRKAEASLRRLGATVPTRAETVRVRVWAVYALAALLGLAYLAQIWFDDQLGLLRAGATLFQPSHVVAAFLQGLPMLPANDVWWRYLSYAFLHGNWVHLGLNLWVLLDIGRHYETRCSWGDMLAAFAVGTAAGAWLTTIFQAGQQVILVGASGGILGIAGALLADALMGRTQRDQILLRSLLQWMAMLLVFSVAIPGVSLWGHAGGALGGFVYGLLRLRLPLGRRFAQAAGLLAAGLMLLALYAALSTVLPMIL